MSIEESFVLLSNLRNRISPVNQVDPLDLDDTMLRETRNPKPRMVFLIEQASYASEGLYTYNNTTTSGLLPDGKVFGNKRILYRRSRRRREKLARTHI